LPNNVVGDRDISVSLLISLLFSTISNVCVFCERNVKKENAVTGINPWLIMFHANVEKVYLDSEKFS